MSEPAPIDAYRAIEKSITLHGLGFLQVQLEANQRLHVWHPELPRRRCFHHSSVHDHRFGFQSLVLRGIQINTNYYAQPAADAGAASHVLYLHEGDRTKFGNRPWKPDGEVLLSAQTPLIVRPGQVYTMAPFVYHMTTPGGDGRVATLMTKTTEADRGAHSSCTIGVQPDVDFDRFQWPESRLWEVVADVLGGSRVSGS
jgi:hypothetical protein